MTKLDHEQPFFGLPLEKVANCPICGGSSFDVIGERVDGISVVECKQCRMGFVESMPSDPSMLYGDQYYASEDSQGLGYEDYELVAAHSLSWVAELIGLLRLDGRVLDVGCADGHLLGLLPPSYERFGIEANEGLLAACEAKGIGMIGRDVLDPALGSRWAGKFDLITAIAVLEHLVDPGQALENLKEMLAPGGVIVFEMPLMSRSSDNSVWLNSSLEHFFYPTVEGLEHLFQKVFSLPLIGREVRIQGYGSNFVGLATNDEGRHRWLSEWFSRLISAPVEELAESERRFRFFFDLIHAAESTKEFVDLLPELPEKRVTRGVLARVAQLWDVDIYRNQELESKLARLTLDDNRNEELESRLLDLRQEIDEVWKEKVRTEFLLEEQVAGVTAELEEKQRALQAVLDSTAWRLTAPLRSVFGKLRSGLQHLPIRPGGVLWRSGRLIYRAIPIDVALKRRFLHYLVVRQILPQAPAEHRVRILSQQEWPAEQPLVSVVIPCFNYGNYVGEAVDSVLAQSFKDVEVVVVDGGSDDPQSVEALRQLNRPRTQVYWREGRRLVGDNRNFGISKASGKYICCLDADDLLRPTYLEKAAYILETQGCDVVSTSYEFFDEGAGTFTVKERPTLADMIEGNHVATCAVFKRTLWEQAGGFCDEGTGAAYVYEDWRLWIRFSALGARILNINREPLFQYRVHSGSLTGNPLVGSVKRHGNAILELEAELLTQAAFSNSSRIQLERVEVVDGTKNLRRGLPEDSRPAVLIALPFMLVGGAERLVSGIARHMQEKGMRVVFVTHLVTDPAHGDTTHWFTPATDEIYHLPRFLDPKHWRDFVFYLLDTRDIGLVWVVGSQLMYDMLAEIRARKPGLKVMDLLFNTVGQTRNNRKQCRWIDVNLVENDEVERWLRARGEPPERIRLIPSGVDLSFYRPLPKPKQLMSALGIAPDTFVVGFSGRWSEEKRPDLFIEIAERLKDDLRISFVMTGSGPLAAAVTKQAENSRMGDRLKLVGNVTDVRDYLAMYDVLLLPSRLDGRPVVVLECLAMGVPVIASRVGGLPDLIDHGKTGYLCDIGDAQSFAERVSWLVDHPSEHIQMKKAARRHAEAELGNKRMNEQYLAVIRELLGLSESGGSASGQP